MGKRSVGLVLSVGLAFSVSVGCGGDDGNKGTGAYDVDEECRETIACMEQDLGPSPAGTLDQCVQKGTDAYAKATATERSTAERVSGQCAGKKACDYVTCVNTALGRDTVTSSPPVGPPLPEDCKQDLQPQTGVISSSIGDFAFSSAEALFWVNDEKCMTEVDVELKSGPCSVRFDASGLLDQEGRYLITTVSLDARGLCPGYPDTLTDAMYLEQADKQPFGTIEVQRENASWLECKPGKLVLRPNVTLTGYGNPDVTFNGIELTVSGNFNETHIQPIDGCPTVFF